MVKKYLTESEAAEMIGLSKRALQTQRLRRKGLPYYKLGRRVLYKVADIEQHMNNNRIAAEE